MYRIGIDVGGTNTDAVLIDRELNLLSQVKVPTSADVQSGIAEALHAVLEQAEETIDRKLIDRAMLGTTQCTNAIVERKDLNTVGLIRLGYPATQGVLPYTAWPEALEQQLNHEYTIARGGYEFDGAELTALDEEEIREVFGQWRGQIQSLAIVGVFSSLQDDQELRVAEIAREEFGADFPISVSSQIGSVGLIERENATILNAALDRVIKRTVDGFADALAKENVSNADVFLCQNDGTLMTIDYAREFPIFTIACGPTNSIRGASHLAQLQEAVVVDVGGTTTDLGVLVSGFPRESALAVDVGGVRTNFRMPDILSIGLGGGSIVREQDGEVTVGPDSVGFEITKHAKVFGGDTLTATDIAVRLGLADIGHAPYVADVPEELALKAYEAMRELVEVAIDQVKTSSGDVDVILVGGGSMIVPTDLAGVAQVVENEHGGVANAIGASMSQIGGEYEQLYIYDREVREDCLADAEKKAGEQAIAAGGDADTIELVEIEETPLAYHPENATRVRVKVVGEIKS